MKYLFVCITVLTWSTAAFGYGAGSALHAIQTVSAQPFAQEGAIVEIKGVRGEPMPAEWTVLLADPSARGGVREVVVSLGRILSERSPMHGFIEVANLPPIDMQRVSIDAADVFLNLNQQATSGKVGFHWIDYVLRNDPQYKKPVWTVMLYDQLGSQIGQSKISADGGTIIEPLVNLLKESQGKRPGGLLGRVLNFSESTSRKVRDTTLRKIGDVQEYLVGDRTVGPQDGE